MDWVDTSDFGIPHFGIDPNLLCRDTIRFDTFHMKCAVTRALMTYLRSFLNQVMTLTSVFKTCSL